MKTKTKGPNVALLRRLARKLRRLRHEKHYDQELTFQKTVCGTAACVAGHTLLECGYRYGNRGLRLPNGAVDSSCDWLSFARKALRLSCNVADRLFSPCPEDDWPEPFRSRWLAAMDNGTERPSRIAADYLDHLADMAEANRKVRKRKAATV